MLRVNYQRTGRSPLAGKLLRAVLSVYLAVALLITCFQLVLEYREEERRLQVELDQMAEAFMPVLTTALWNLDNEQIASSTGGIWVNPAVWRVVVTDDLDQTIVDRSRPYGAFVDRWQLPWYEYRYDIVYQDDSSAGTAVGQMTLSSNAFVVARRATSTFFYTILNALLKTLVLWLIFHYALTRMVSRPLSILTAASHRINPDSRSSADSQAPSLTEFHTEDELGELAKSFSDLESSLIEKNGAIAAHQHKLEQSITELEDALATKSIFLAHMNHELRTPMNGLLGTVALLRDTSLTREQAAYIATLTTSGNQLLDVINNVLDYSKNQSGHQELESITFNVAQLATECVDTFQAMAKNKGLELKLQMLVGDHEWLCGDPFKLTQILNNLISNAIKFTHEGGVVVMVRCEPCNGRIILHASVTDTGIGMTASQRERLFQPFQQGDQSTVREYGGTGLGLAICKQLTDMMGGAIRVDSRVGEGTTFTCELRLDEAEAPEPDASRHADSSASLHQYPELRVLVAEDNPVNQMVIRGFLRKFGIEPDLQVNGADAVKQFQTSGQIYDLVFMDIEMPVMDGWEATRILRQTSMQRKDETPLTIVGLSAHALKTDAEKSGLDKMDDYLSKPISIGDIAGVLEWVESARSPPGAV